MELNRVNQFLANQIVPQEEVPVVNGPEAIKNIVVSNLIDIGRLHKIEDELITYLSRDLNRLSKKEQQSLLRDVDAISSRKEDFAFKVAQEVNKNQFLNKVFNMATTETVVSENGEVFDSSISKEQKNELKTLLIDLLNDNSRV